VADPPNREVADRTIIWQWAGVVVFLLLVAAFPAYRAVESGRRAEALAEREAALVSMGRDVWANNCASCHGAGGVSDEVGTPSLNAQQFLMAATDEQIHHVVAAGVPGTEMPAWWVEFGGALTDEQIRAAVAFVRSWEDTAPDLADWRNLPAAEPAAGHDDEEPMDEHTPRADEAAASERPSPEPRHNLVEVAMDDVACQPTEFEVDAGRPVTVRVDNQGTVAYTFAIDALDLHEHTPPGQVTTLELTFDQEGKYRFECLGSGHGSVLGVGVIRAR
jgi:mono/diheme cytochrome c family protein